LAVSAYPGAARGLSSRGPTGGGVGGSVSSGNRASHRQRLGGAARQPIFPGESSSPAVGAGQGQSHGVRMGGRAITDSLSQSGGGLGGDSGPGSSSGRKTQGDHAQETKAAYSQSRSPLAAPLEQTRDTASVVDPCNVRLREHRKCREVGIFAGDGERSRGWQAAKKMAARRTVEKTRAGKVKEATFPPRLEIPQTPRDSHFPTASAATRD
jgi:hypothetical protein